MFPRPHGIFIGHADRVHPVDCWDHTIRTFTTGGTLLRTIGESGECSDTGFVPEVLPVQYYAGGPFNQVTNVAVLLDGGMYVADGCGNARVHRFDAEGNLEFSFGRQRGPVREMGVVPFAQLLALAVELVGEAFEEQHPEDELLELAGVHLAAQDVRGRTRAGRG